MIKKCYPRRSRFPLYSGIRKIFHKEGIKYTKIGNVGISTFQHQHQKDVPPVLFRFDTGEPDRVRIYSQNRSWSYEATVYSAEELLAKAKNFFFTINRFKP